MKSTSEGCASSGMDKNWPLSPSEQKCTTIGLVAARVIRGPKQMARPKPNKRMKPTGAAILVSRGMKVLQAAPAAYPYRSAAEGLRVASRKQQIYARLVYDGLLGLRM